MNESRLQKLDKIGCGVAGQIPHLDEVPAVIFVENGDLGAVVQPGDDRGVIGGPLVDVQGPLFHLNHPGQGIAGAEKGDAEELGEGEHQVFRHGVDVGGDPDGVLVVVVVPQLQQH